MIFNTLSQLNSFFILLFFGVICGFFSIVFYSLTLKNHNKKLLKIIFDCVFYSFFAIFYVFLINFFNFGNFSLTLAGVYLLGFIWTKNVFKNLLVILENKCYTIYSRAIKNFTKPFKRKQRKIKGNEPTKQN